MKDYKDDIIQLIDNKFNEWKNFDIVSYTNGLDENEYFRRLEKIIRVNYIRFFVVSRIDKNMDA